MNPFIPFAKPHVGKRLDRFILAFTNIGVTTLLLSGPLLVFLCYILCIIK